MWRPVVETFRSRRRSLPRLAISHLEHPISGSIGAVISIARLFTITVVAMNIKFRVQPLQIIKIGIKSKEWGTTRSPVKNMKLAASVLSMRTEKSFLRATH